MIIQNATINQGGPPIGAASSDLPKVTVDTSKQVIQQEPSPQQLKSAVDTINQIMRQSNQNLEFSVDPGTKRPVVKIVDSSTGELIRQIPSEETLAIAHSIDEFLQRGLLLRQEA